LQAPPKGSAHAGKDRGDSETSEGKIKEQPFAFAPIRRAATIRFRQLRREQRLECGDVRLVPERALWNDQIPGRLVYQVEVARNRKVLEVFPKDPRVEGGGSNQDAVGGKNQLKFDIGVRISGSHPSRQDEKRNGQPQQERRPDRAKQYAKP